MAGFHLTRDGPHADARLAAARARFASHGFRHFGALTAPGWRGFHTGYVHGGPECFHAEGADWIAAAGTLVYDRELGAPALAGLLRDFAFPFTDWTKLTGQFALLVHKGGRTFALTDYFGAFQLFHDPAFETLSTSFLGLIDGLPRVRWKPQGVYEFAFNVFPLGEDTVFEEVSRLGPLVQLELTAGVTAAHAVTKPLPDRPSDLPLAERIERNAALLSATVAPFAEAFGSRMQVPLSGGLDSRLALACLRARGVRPHVYVYGEPEDEDVRVAQSIGAAEGFKVELFNKPAYRPIGPDEYAEQVARNFDETDALVTDGGLFDNGGNAFARHARNAGGQLAVSGGCGEVFRSFFFLPEGRFTARDIARAFWSRYVTGDATDAFDPRAFVGRIAEKLARSLGRSPRERLGRTEVEQLYPRERCRSFFGREVSLVGRHGAYLMPFLHWPVVAEALQIPLGLKWAGAFEAQLLNHIDPSLARHMSAYGHSFAEPPSAAHRREEWGTRIRPARLRAQSYRVRRLVEGRLGDEHGGLLTPIYLGQVIDLHFPAMRRFFHPARTERDSGLYRRVATLEYLAERLGSKIASD